MLVVVTRRSSLQSKMCTCMMVMIARRSKVQNKCVRCVLDRLALALAGCKLRMDGLKRFLGMLCRAKGERSGAWQRDRCALIFHLSLPD